MSLFAPPSIPVVSELGQGGPGEQEHGGHCQGCHNLCQARVSHAPSHVLRALEESQLEAGVPCKGGPMEEPVGVLWVDPVCDGVQQDRSRDDSCLASEPWMLRGLLHSPWTFCYISEYLHNKLMIPLNQLHFYFWCLFVLGTQNPEQSMQPGEKAWFT